jgi:hypothetical protein
MQIKRSMYDKTQTIHILKIVHLQSTITYQYIYIK